MKKKRRGNLLIIPIVFCLAVAGFSIWTLYGYYRGYHDGEKEYEQLTKYVKEKNGDEKKDSKNEKKDECPIAVDFQALQAINKDIAGWVHIPDTGISYPIVQGIDNEYYLKHTFEKKQNFSGAIFLDIACRKDFTSDNSIIYGHNLKTGAMFGELKKLYDISYNADADYRKHPVIWIVTPESAMEYQVFAAREISVVENMDVYMADFAQEEEYSLWLKEQKASSQYETETDISSAAPMVTLSTCTSDSEDGRFVLQAIRIQEIVQ